MAASGRHWEQDKEATVYVGNLDERVTDAIVWELMLQAGRIVNVHLPKDRVSQSHQGYGFVEFSSEEDADYAAKIMNQIALYGKRIRVNKASADKQKTTEVGAELFVGNLDGMVDEKILYDAFVRFGPLVTTPKVARDPSNQLSKGYGFVSFATFEASDDAIAAMHGSYLMNKEITVQYAFKKDGKGERHGDEAERRLATQAKAHGVQPTIHQMPAEFLAAPRAAPAPVPVAAPPTAPPMSIMNGMPPQMGTPPVPNGFTNPYPPPPQMMNGYGSHHAHQNQPRNNTPSNPLPPPPAGLPSRPPPFSQAAYVGGLGPGGAPPPQGFGNPPGFPPQGMPAGFAPPPPGAFPPPPGFPMPMGQAPPPGAPQYGRR